MKIKMSTFQDSNFHSLANRMHGELELLQFEYDIVAVTTTNLGSIFYGVIYYKVKDEFSQSLE